MSYDLIPGNSISSSSLSAERVRMEIAANNIANAQSTSPNGENIYKRKIAVFESVLKDEFNRDSESSLGGVKVTDIVQSEKPPIEVYNPFHPHADKNGMLKKPDISPLEEMIDMMTATKAYETTLSIMKQSKKMAEGMIKLGSGQ